MYRNWNRWFENMVTVAFRTVDLDNNGTVDPKEFYVGVLLLYLKLNTYITIKPPSQEFISNLVKVADVDNSGELDFDEFRMVMQLLQEQVLCRALTQLAFIITCPLVAGLLVKCAGPFVQRQLAKINAKGKKKLENAGAPGRASLVALRKVKSSAQKLRPRLPAALHISVLSAVMMMLTPRVMDLLDDGLMKRGIAVVAVWAHPTRWKRY